MKSPSQRQIEALRRFAKGQGRYWKRSLKLLWSTGNYHDYPVSSEDTQLLQQIRNVFGPGWLYSKNARTLFDGGA